MENLAGEVSLWQEKIVIPTYEVGQADKNPMFLEKRVYQGSSGKVYPCPVIDKIYDEKIDKEYNAIWLENDYLRIMILPELGGRIQRAYDKTNDYDFVYYNEVIKPALVGLTGPWISGGIEFNWPQHHRPTTFCPVDFLLCENEDGSKTVRVSEIDQMYGTKGMASFTLYKDKAFLEIKGQLYNPTALPQTFLWWANPAVAVNDDTQSIFPPDVHAVMDHGKRDVSRFPIATGVYYKHDYGDGVDISRYKNVPVPTSYMAYHSDYDFVGGYDYGINAGVLHIADHHISPGKKQWTWGNGDFGQAWDRNLTDENGPYIELMTGMFTDNQPDFTWLKPFEEKQFLQYFMPYKKVPNIKNASTEVVIGLSTENGDAQLCVYATSIYENARITLKGKDNIILDEVQTISPTQVFEKTVDSGEYKPEELMLFVYDNEGKLLLSYVPAAPKVEKIPNPAVSAKAPQDILTQEELYLTGLHIEQYRHATYLPDGYYLEGLKRDAGDSRINVAYGQLLLRRGLFSESEKHFRAATNRLTLMNPNPYYGEAFYCLGLSLFYQGRKSAAFDAFYKSTWSNAEQELGFYYLAAISMEKGEWLDAQRFIERSLIKNSHNMYARGLKAVLLRKIGADTKEWLNESLEIDPFDYLCRFERDGFNNEKALELMRDEPQAFLAVARRYAQQGLWQEAENALLACKKENPMLFYYQAYYLAKQKKPSLDALAKAQKAPSLYCFPNQLEDIAVLEYACANSRDASKAFYYLGNLWYDKRQYKIAQNCWEKSVELDCNFATPWRNLAFAYFNKENNAQKAQSAMEKAFSLDNTDARVFLELDQLYKKCGFTPKMRIINFEKNTETFEKRDDLWVEYITLLNLLGRYSDAFEKIMSHKFHPWEGGEGKITTQYSISLISLAKKAISEKEFKKAKNLLEQALVFPHNLGEGKLEGARDNDIYYYLGCAMSEDGDESKAIEYWTRAAINAGEPAGMMYYNDQPADRILYQGLALRKLGREKEARSCFNKLVNYAQKHLFDEISIDYFAVSLPDLQLFDEDLTMRNQAHCQYLDALGSFGLGEKARALSCIEQTLQADPAHLGAVIHLQMFEQI